MPNTDKNGEVIEDSTFWMSNTTCECGSTNFELRNYDMAFHDGDIHCAQCGKFIRTFDAG